MIQLILAGIAAVVMIFFIIFFKNKENKVQYIDEPIEKMTVNPLK